MRTAEIIQNYAEARNSFTLNDIANHVRFSVTISDSGILWHIKRLIKENRLFKISRGLYCSAAKKNFQPTLSPKQKKLYFDIHSAFPLVDLCVYSGTDISALQHNVASNNATYVEVAKDATQAVFHWLTDLGLSTFHRPSAKFMSEYVNLSHEPIIIKPLVTEAPLIIAHDVAMPSLEKLLVDINTDSDFYYLQDGESFHIMEYAETIYNINQPKMLRYASRRGVRNMMIELLNNQQL